MVISSWFAVLQGRIFGIKKPSRNRESRASTANQASVATESLEQRTLMTVNAVNDLYTGIPELNEDDFYTQDAIGGVLANDPAGNGTSVATQLGSDPGFLLRPDGSFDFNAPALPILQSLQHGESQNYTVSYIVEDDDGFGTVGFVTLNVLGLNDAPSVSNATYNDAYTEDQVVPVSLQPILVSDIDTNDEVTATLTLSNLGAGSLAAPGASFLNGVLSVTGTVSDVNLALAAITFTPSANFDSDFTIGVEVGDGLEDGAVAATGTISMMANPVADNPSAADSAFSIDEDSGPYSGTLIGSDPDTNPVLTFALTGTAATKGSVIMTNPATGAFTYTPNGNANGTDTFQFQVTDETLLTSFIQTVTVTINPINDAPVFFIGTDESVLEDSGAHVVAGFATGIAPGPASATDESGQSLTINVTNNNNGLFSVQPAIDGSGQLTYTLAPNAFGTAVVSVTVMDNGLTANGGSDTAAVQTFQIDVDSVNDAPSFGIGGDQFIDEDAGTQTVLMFAHGMNPGPGNESGQTLQFQVTTSDDSKFTTLPVIDSMTGTLTYEIAPDANGDLTITVLLSDNGGTANGGVNTSGSQSFTIHVNPIQDEPVAQNDSATVNEDETVNIDVLANDFDADGDPLQMYISAAAHGFASINSNGTPGDFTDDFIQYTPHPDFNGTDSFTYVVDDHQGGIDFAVVTITVNAVNDAPSFVIGNDQVVAEDSGSSSVTGFITTAQPGPVSASDESSQTLEFIVTNDNNSLFSIQPAIAPDGKLTYSVSPNANGVANVTVQVRDNGGLALGGVDTSIGQVFTITVTPINDAPSFTSGPNQTLIEDSPAQVVPNWATSISAGSGDAGQTLTFNVTGNSNPSLFSVAPAISADGTLSYTLAPNANGLASITINLSDDGLTLNGGSDTSGSQTFTINATPVNDAPTFIKGADQTVLEDSGAATVAAWANSLSKGPSNESGQTLQFTVTADDPSLFSVQPSIDPVTGTLTFTPAANRNGTTTVTVTLGDDGGTDDGGVDTSISQTFEISIDVVNDVPGFTVGPNQSVLEDAGPQTVTDWATEIFKGPDEAIDEVNQILTFVATNDNNALFAVQPFVASNGTLTYTPAPNAYGSATVTVSLSDNGGTSNGGVNASATQTFTISVASVNDAPTVTSATLTVPENSAVNTVVGTVVATDPDVSETKSFAITGGNTGGTFAINATTGQITVANNTLLDFETQSTFNLTVTVTDSANATGTANITIQLTNVDDPLTLSLPNATPIYVRRGGAVSVDSGATLSDQDTVISNFGGGTLRVTNVAVDRSDSNDRLGVINQGTGTGKIYVSGSKIYFESTSNLIGNITHGKSGGELVIALTSNSTQAAMNALLKAVTFRNTSDSPRTGLRNINFELRNAAGSVLAAAAKQVRVTNGTTPPVVTLPSGAVSYANSATPVVVDGAATVTDSDSPHFRNGKLSVNVTQGVNSNNRVVLFVTGGITLSGKDIFYQGLKIGRLTSGANTLSVSFSSDAATPEAVQALVRAIGFGTTNSNTNLADRVLQFRLTDGSGGSSQIASKLIHVTAQSNT